MKKYVIGGLVAAALVVYLVFANMKNTPAATTTPPAITSTNDGGSSSSTNMGGMAMGNYKDGMYTGPVTNAFYGNIEVIVTVANGMITKIDTPVVPNDPGHTMEVTNSAIPVLKQEAIAAQSAKINAVSGATQDSQAFEQSLSAALAQAS